MNKILLRSTRCFLQYGASYLIISLTPKRLLKTQVFEKMTILPVKEIHWPIFSRSID